MSEASSDTSLSESEPLAGGGEGGGDGTDYSRRPTTPPGNHRGLLLPDSAVFLQKLVDFQAGLHYEEEPPGRARGRRTAWEVYDTMSTTPLDIMKEPL